MQLPSCSGEEGVEDGGGDDLAMTDDGGGTLAGDNGTAGGTI
jgi:hypothetical protein